MGSLMAAVRWLPISQPTSKNTFYCLENLLMLYLGVYDRNGLLSDIRIIFIQHLRLPLSLHT
jgi:hypothetical protein